MSSKLRERFDNRRPPYLPEAVSALLRVQKPEGGVIATGVEYAAVWADARQQEIADEVFIRVLDENVTPVEDYEEIARKFSRSVKIALALRDDVPEHVRNILRADPDKNVAAAANYVEEAV